MMPCRSCHNADRIRARIGSYPRTPQHTISFELCGGWGRRTECMHHAIPRKMEPKEMNAWPCTSMCIRVSMCKRIDENKCTCVCVCVCMSIQMQMQMQMNTCVNAFTRVGVSAVFARTHTDTHETHARAHTRSPLACSLSL